jgi:hypothetical protein
VTQGGPFATQASAYGFNGNRPAGEVVVVFAVDRPDIVGDLRAAVVRKLLADCASRVGSNGVEDGPELRGRMLRSSRRRMVNCSPGRVIIFRKRRRFQTVRVYEPGSPAAEWNVDTRLRDSSAAPVIAAFCASSEDSVAAMSIALARQPA